MNKGRKVDFIIIGAMKSATTSLYEYLSSHDHIFFPTNKEPDYFIEEKHLNKGEDWYLSLFSNASDNQLLGEASTSYSKYPGFKGVPERIHKHNKSMKLIYLLRNPIERARSHYQHNLGYGRVKESFSDSIRAENSIYINCGLYHMQLEQYLKYFNKDQVLVVLTNDLVTNTKDTLNRIFGFLGLENSSILHQGIYNASSSKTKRSRLNIFLKKLAFIKIIKKTIPKRFVDSYLNLTESKIETFEISDDDRIFLKNKFKNDIEKLSQDFNLKLDQWN